MTAHSDLHWPSMPAPGAWRHDAACRGVDPGIFFPEGALALEAKAICRSCPVIAECRNYARAHPALHAHPEPDRCTMNTTTKCPRRGSNRPGTDRDPREVPMSSDATCSIVGCEKPHESRGWCHMHYCRWWKHGDPLWHPPTPEARFWAHVDKFGPDGYHSQTGENLGPCWLWTASQNHKGYGQLWVAGRMVRTHRFAYELLVGPIPDGLQPDHLCRVRHCVNPLHLEPVTPGENCRRCVGARGGAAKNAAKTHCPAGHEYSPENTYISRRGGRHCRACSRARDAARAPRRKESKT